MDLLGRRGCGAAPSSLLLVRISPSVMTVKRPCALRHRPVLHRRLPRQPARAPSGPAPPVKAGAVTSTEPSAAAAHRDERNDQVVVGQRREDEVLRRAALEMIVDVEHALAAIGHRPLAGIFHQLGREGAVRIHRRSPAGRTSWPSARASLRFDFALSAIVVSYSAFSLAISAGGAWTRLSDRPHRPFMRIRRLDAGPLLVAVRHFWLPRIRLGLGVRRRLQHDLAL